MGIFRQVASAFTGIPLEGKRPSGSSDNAGDQDDKTGSDYGETYGQRTLRRVKRATKRIGGDDKGNGR